MDFSNLKPIHLHIEELNYELRVRGILTTRKDVNIKRKMLHRRLDTERGPDIELVDPDFDIDNEKRIIDETLGQLRNLINKFNGPETDSDFQRIRSRLIYITNRVKRIKIPTIDSDNSVQLYKNESYATCVELETLLFDSIVQEQPLPNLNTLSPPQSLPQPSVRLSSGNQQFQNSVPVYKWDISKFNGDSNTLLSFLNRIDELSKARNVTKSELLASAADLFSDKAYIWFKSIENSVNDWDQLVALLKTYFLPSDFDDRIWDDIRDRTQGKKEPIHIYIAVMQTYFNLLQKPVHEGTKLRYIRKGILPHYNERLSVVTNPIKTVSELLDWCRKIDESQSYANDYHAPPKTSKFCPELIYLSNTEPSTSSSNVSVNTISYSFINTNSNKSRNINKNVDSNFNNCGQPNHSYLYCTAIKTKFCFKCGMKNKTIRTCSCSKNERGRH